MGYVAERPYSKILFDSIRLTSNPDLTGFVGDFRHYNIDREVADLTIDKVLDFVMPPLFRASASYNGSIDLILQTTGQYQDGVSMLVYAINFNRSINDITLDLSFCKLGNNRAKKPLQALSRLNKRIKHLNLRGNVFTKDELCFLFQNLWDGAAPTFDIIDCRANEIDFTLKDIQCVTTKRPECTYVLMAIKKNTEPREDIFPPRRHGVFMMTTEAETAVYEICNGRVLSKNSAPVLEDADPVPVPVLLAAVVPRVSQSSYSVGGRVFTSAAAPAPVSQSNYSGRLTTAAASLSLMPMSSSGASSTARVFSAPVGRRDLHASYGSFPSLRTAESGRPLLDASPVVAEASSSCCSLQ